MRPYVRVLIALLLPVTTTSVATWLVAMLNVGNGVAPDKSLRNGSIVGLILGLLCACVLSVAVIEMLAKPLRRLLATLRNVSTQARTLSAKPGTIAEAVEIAALVAQSANREKLYAAAVTGSEDAIVTEDQFGFITSWNPAAQRLYGYAAGEVAGKHINIIVPPERQAELQQIVERIQAGEQTQNIETIRVTRDGEHRHVSLSISPVRSVSGEVLGACGIARDITKRIATERRLQELQATMAYAARMSTAEEMAGALAHELNQPLSSISNYVSAAVHRLSRLASEEITLAKDYMAKAGEEARRASLILRRLRDFVQRRELHRNEEDLNEVVEGALSLASVYLSSVNVSKQLRPDLPRVWIDLIQIQQVILNLVRNAAEAMAGCAQRDLLIETYQNEDDEIVVSVSDTGIGLPENMERKLFRPFTSTKAHGMGIGLSISRTIIEAHDGTLAASCRPDRGTTFSFRLPLAEREQRNVA